MPSRPEQFSHFLHTCIALIVLSVFLLTSQARGQSPGTVLISEIYGGGGNSGALYTHDFIELYNPTDHDIGMLNWSVQYQSGGGSGPFGAVASFTGTIPSHGYFLLQGNQGSGGTKPLPSADAIAAFPMAATSGKIALVSDTLPVSGSTDTLVVDFVGYGSANIFEGGGPAGGAGNTSSIERKAAPGSDAATMGPGGIEEFHGNGHDSDDNADDFTPRAEPEPQNSAAGREHPGGDVILDIGYSEKWNLVSVPMEVADTRVSVLFPGALTSLYTYAGGYVPDTLAVVGRGYWVKLESRDTIHFTGSPIGSDTIVLDTGWNLVGSVTAAVPVSAVEEVPPGHLESGFYSFDGGYTEVATLDPGRGYWVRSAGGSIILISGTLVPGSRGGEIERPTAIPALPALTGIDLPPQPPGAPVRAEGGSVRTTDRQVDMLRLKRVSPNPFNPRTRIVFDISEGAEIEVTIVDLSGRHVATLLREYLQAGTHSVSWDVSGEGSREVSSGVYIARIRGLGRELTQKLLLMK